MRNRPDVNPIAAVFLFAVMLFFAAGIAFAAQGTAERAPKDKPKKAIGWGCQEYIARDGGPSSYEKVLIYGEFSEDGVSFLKVTYPDSKNSKKEHRAPKLDVALRKDCPQRGRMFVHQIERPPSPPRGGRRP